MSTQQIQNVQRLITATKARISTRKAKHKPTKNLEKTLSKYEKRLRFYQAKSPEEFKALKGLEGVAYTEATGTGEIIATTNKPKTATKAKTKREGVTAEKIQDLHADLDKLKSDADTLQELVGLTKKQQTEIKQTIKEIEKTRDKLKGRSESIKNIKSTVSKIEKIRDDLTEKKEMYRVGGTGPKFKETMQTLQDKADEFFSKSGLPSEDTLNNYLKEHPGARLGPSKWQPKDTEEALNRLGYAATQMIIGGAVEEGLPFSLTAVPPLSRSADRGFRTLGGLLTPSPADLLAGQLIAKIAKSKAWRKITGKYGEVKITELEKEALRQVEKFKTPGQQYSTAEIRKGVNKVYRSIEEIAEFYSEHPELATAERSSAGAAQVPKLVTEFEDYLDDIGWDMDYYYEFMRSRAPDLPIGALVNVLAGSMDRGTSLDETAESLTEFYRDAPDSALISRDESKVIPETEEKETPHTGGAVGPEPQIVEEVTKQKPKIGEPQETIQMPVSIEDVPEVPPSESPKPLPPTPPLKLSKPDQEKRREMRLRLYAGPKGKYSVKYNYRRGSPEVVVVEARGLGDAMNRAQRVKKPNRYLPDLVDIRRIQR